MFPAFFIGAAVLATPPAEAARMAAILRSADETLRKTDELTREMQKVHAEVEKSSEETQQFLARQEKLNALNEAKLKQLKEWLDKMNAPQGPKN